MGGMHHPWRAVRGLPDWRVYFTDRMPAGVRGATRWRDRTIWVRAGLSQVERRCTIEHERQHVLLGPGSHGPGEERLVRQAAARELVTVEVLADALRWSRHPAVVADWCWVTVSVLGDRMDHLHPAERHALRRAVEHHEETA